MYALLLHLLRAALWGTDVKVEHLTPEEFAKLLRLSKKQTVHGLVLQALMDNNVHLEKHDAVECLTMHRDIVRQNGKMNDAIRMLSNVMQDAQLPFVIVKGQTLLPLYRKGESRISGDIDFYCPPAIFEQAKDLLTERWQVEWEVDEEEGFQHYACEHEDITYEMHFCLKKFYSRRSQHYFDTIIAETLYVYRNVDGIDVPVLQPHLEVCYTFLHLYHHLVNKGIALRQFCDLAMLLNKEEYDAEMLRDVLKQVDHVNAFKAVGAVLVDVIGLPPERFPYSLSKRDYSYVKPLMTVVLRHGNFGFYGNKTKTRSGWKYYREAFTHKVTLLKQFHRLAPRESRNTLLRAIPQKVFFATRRQQRK